MDEYSYVGPLTLGGERRTYIMPYVMDTFKVRSNLTLNYGLRYEHYSVLKEAFGRQAVVKVSCGGFCPMGTPLYSRTIWTSHHGWVWHGLPGEMQKNGYPRRVRMYFSPNQMDDFTDGHERRTYGLMFRQRMCPISPGQFFPPCFLPRYTRPRRGKRTARNGYFENWDFTVERVLPGNFIGQIAYDGSEGHRLFGKLNANVIDPETGERPIPTFGEYGYKNNLGNSNFHSLQVSLQRHLTSGWLWGTQYMWSHGLADEGFGAGDTTNIQNVSCIRCDYSSSDIDIRQSLSVNSVYELPFGRGKHFLSSGGAAGRSWAAGN